MKHLLLGAAILLAGLTVNAASQDMPFAGLGGGEPGGRMIEALKLTDAQKTEFGKLRADHQKKMIDQMAKVASARIDLRELLKADKPDRSAIEKKMQEVAGLMTQTQSARLDFWFAVQKNLTADQQKVWKKALENPMAMGQHPGMRMRGDRGGMMRGMQERREMMRHQGMMRERGPEKSPESN